MELGLFGAYDGGRVGEGSPAPLRVFGGAPPVLALHGFTGTPNEVRLVTDAAGKLGASAYAPLLPGHGTHARDLARTGWDDWTSAADRALLEVLDGTGKAVVAGLSMGALLAMHLAATRPERVAGLIVMANAAWLPWPFPSLPMVLLEHAPIDTRRLYLPKIGADINDPARLKTHQSYSANPVRAAIEVMRGGRAVRAECGKITCPTLIVHGAKDRVCPPANARKIAALLGTRDVEVMMLPRSGHIVTADLDRDVLSDRIESFLARVRRPLEESPLERAAL